MHLQLYILDERILNYTSDKDLKFLLYVLVTSKVRSSSLELIMYFHCNEEATTSVTALCAFIALIEDGRH
jgi:hypothetical protein